MGIPFHPQTGTIVICDYKSGFIVPEMVKRRPAIIISPRFRNRDCLCTVVPLSTTPPIPVMPYNYRIRVSPALPSPYDSEFHWVKADMISTVCLKRLFLPHRGKNAQGKRNYITQITSVRLLYE